VSPSAPQTAAWARDNINEGQFLYAFSLATFLRDDLNDIILPAPYEIYPYLFVDADVIQKAYETKMWGEYSKQVLKLHYLQRKTVIIYIGL
jgi:hypothetical protein